MHQGAQGNQTKPLPYLFQEDRAAITTLQDTQPWDRAAITTLQDTQPWDLSAITEFIRGVTAAWEVWSNYT